ncbi:MAG: alpha/beta hydrolase [Caenibius sp.]
MADGHLARVAPDLRAFVELLPDLSRLDARLGEVRSLLAGEPAPLGDDGEVMTEEVFIPRADGTQQRALLLRPSRSAATALPALLHVHGGGYVAGTADRDHEIARREVLDLQCVVLVPDYRLAPEHPYPAPLDDVLDAWRWLHTQGIDSTRAAIRGVSAGGGLAYATALKLREEGEIAPCLTVLLFPMLDDRTENHQHNGVYVWTHDNNVYGWNSYLAGVDRANPPPLAVPGRVDDVSGLPPVYLATGSIDLFAGENLDLARKLIDAGIALELHSWPGAYHGFSLVPCEAGRAYEQSARAAMARAFARDDNGETR